MKPTQAISAVTSQFLKDSVPEFGVGDTVRVSVKVVEGTRERTQVFEGVVMRRRGGGINENFTVRRIASHGIGVERTFLLNSPRVEKIEVVRRGVVRRAQLYYLRGLTGKAARIKERRYNPALEAARRAAKMGGMAPVIAPAEMPTNGAAGEHETEADEVMEAEAEMDDTMIAEADMEDQDVEDETEAEEVMEEEEENGEDVEVADANLEPEESTAEA